MSAVRSRQHPPLKLRYLVALPAPRVCHADGRLQGQCETGLCPPGPCASRSSCSIASMPGSPPGEPAVRGDGGVQIRHQIGHLRIVLVAVTGRVFRAPVYQVPRRQVQAIMRVRHAHVGPFRPPAQAISHRFAYDPRPRMRIVSERGGGYDTGREGMVADKHVQLAGYACRQRRCQSRVRSVSPPVSKRRSTMR